MAEVFPGVPVRDGVEGTDTLLSIDKARRVLGYVAGLHLEGALLMDQVRLGATGLHVSRVCLGMMSYGNDSDRPWVLDEDARRADHPAARSRPASPSSTPPTSTPAAPARSPPGALVPKYLSRDEVGDRHQGPRPMTPGPQRRAACRASTSSPRSTRRCSGSAWTTSTSTRSTAGTRTRRSRRRWRRCTTSCGPARPATSAPAACTPGSSPRPSTSPSATAGRAFVSMQNHYNLLYREEEREMIPLCLDQGVGVIPWSPLARGFLTGTRTREGERRTTARGDRRVRRTSSTAAPRTSTSSTALDEVAGERGVLAGAGRAGLAAAQARRDRADRRRHQARAPRGRHRRRRAVAVGRRDRAPRGALRAPPGARATSSGVEGHAPSPPETWDALFSDFYLRAFADDEARRRCRRQRAERGAAGGLPRGRRPARRALRLRAPRDPAGARRLPRHGRRPLADAARRGPPARGRRWPPELVEADYRELPFPDERFDAALNLFTSLGFYGDEEDVKALAEIGRVLRPGGRLVIEIMHRDRLVRGFHEQDWRLVGEGRLLLEQRTFDAGRRRGADHADADREDGRARLAHVLGPRLHRDRARGHADCAPASPRPSATATSTAGRSARPRGSSSSPGAPR